MKYPTKIFYFTNPKSMLDALRQLVNHPSASDLHITTNLEWDEKVPFSNPHTHTYTGGVVLALNNSGRVEQRQKVHVQGFVEKDGKFYIVTPKYSSAYRLFPRISSRMAILYNVDLCLSHFTVTRMVNGTKHLMNISIMHNGTDTVDATTIFQSHIVRELKVVSDDALVGKRKEKEQRDRLARSKVLRSPTASTATLHGLTRVSTGTLTRLLAMDM